MADSKEIYREVAQMAYDTIMEVMEKGESDGKTGWLEDSADYHSIHAKEHIQKSRAEVKHIGHGEQKKHNTHAVTRCAMKNYILYRYDK